jgi:hypothetical protein
LFGNFLQKFFLFPSLLKIITNRNLITYPQIFHDNKLVGGFEDLYNYIAGEFDYDKLYNVAYLATVNLNKVIS